MYEGRSHEKRREEGEEASGESRHPAARWGHVTARDQKRPLSRRPVSRAPSHRRCVVPPRPGPGSWAAAVRVTHTSAPAGPGADQSSGCPRTCSPVSPSWTPAPPVRTRRSFEWTLRAESEGQKADPRQRYHVIRTSLFDSNHHHLSSRREAANQTL